MFSRRAQWFQPLNELTIERRKRSGLLDLTESNPTRAGFDYPLDELADAFARGSRAAYDPDPRGLLPAREAIAEHVGCSAGELIVTASTSEAYAFLFKLLADPGDAILTPVPSYPLLEHLAGLELVNLLTFPATFHQRWEIESVPVLERTKAIVVVNPNNPTGAFVSAREQEQLAALGIPLISDEVFLPYPLDGTGSTFVRDDVLTFTLGGLSKSAGLPHVKLGWIRVSGPGKEEALDALELIADNFLSVSTPVQHALTDLLRIGSGIRTQILDRARRNLGVLRAALPPHVQSLPVEGGWTAVLRAPRTRSDEELALELLDGGVIVQPGFFFDFPADGYIVVSLLTPEETFAEGIRRVMEIV